MRVMYFCYERSSVDRHWEPVVYYDEKPMRSSQSKEATPDRTEVWQVPEDCCDPVKPGRKHNGHNPEPNFGKLQKKFPAPIIPKEPKYVIASQSASQ